MSITKEQLNTFGVVNLILDMASNMDLDSLREIGVNHEAYISEFVGAKVDESTIEAAKARMSAVLQLCEVVHHTEKFTRSHPNLFASSAQAEAIADMIIGEKEDNHG